jgi:hypothetical protein
LDEAGNKVEVYESELVRGKNTPKYNSFCIKAENLAAVGYSKLRFKLETQFLIECCDEDTEELIGSCVASMAELIQLPELELLNPQNFDKNYKKSGILVVSHCVVGEPRRTEDLMSQSPKILYEVFYCVLLT